jgi:hypothetical protein
MELRTCSLAVLLVGSTAALAAADTLYAVGNGVGDNSSNLYRIDNYATAPTATDIGETGRVLLDLAIDPTTGVAYAIDDGSSLYHVDLTNATTTLIGPLGVQGENALEFAADGTLYSWGYNNPTLYRIDLATGAATGVLDVGAHSGGDLAYKGGMLYGSTGTSLVRIDLHTQTTTSIGAFGFSDMFGLDFDDAGVLYGAQGTNSSGFADLFKIDEGTGLATLIGPINGASSMGLLGMSFVSGGVAGPSIYCTAKVNSAGCVPSIDWSGIADVRGPDDFLITCTQVLPEAPGQLLYGFGQAAKPFQGGFLCVHLPVFRTPLMVPSGTGGCDNTVVVDFDAMIRGLANPELVAGATVDAQFMLRDAGSPRPYSLSNALEFVISP